MRRALLASGLVLGGLLCSAGPALAENVPWLSVSPPGARAGDTVVFTITGPPGNEAGLAYSVSSLGFSQLNGQHVLLGPDLTVLASGTIGSGGAWTSSVTIPPEVLGEVFFQGAVWPPGSPAMTLTKGNALYIIGGGKIAVAVSPSGSSTGADRRRRWKALNSGLALAPSPPSVKRRCGPRRGRHTACGHSWQKGMALQWDGHDGNGAEQSALAEHRPRDSNGRLRAERHADPEVIIRTQPDHDRAVIRSTRPSRGFPRCTPQRPRQRWESDPLHA